MPGRVQRVDQSPLEIFQIGLSTYLRPPLLEHGLVVVANVQLLAVQEADLQLVQADVDPGVEALALAAPVPLDLVALLQHLFGLLLQLVGAPAPAMIGPATRARICH